MIKRRFFKVDHGDRDGSDHSSSSSDEDYDNQTTEVSQESDDDDNEVSSPSSGYKSEDSSANDIDANSVDTNSAGPLFSEDDAGTINDRNVFINKKFSSERDSKKFNVVPEKKPLPADIQSAFVVQIKSVFKCRLCPRIICLTEDTLRNHLQSKRHARSEKQHKEGRLKTMLNSDGEIENQEDSEKETEDTEDDTIPKMNDKVPKPHKERFKKKKRDKPNSRKMRSSKGSSKRSRKK